MVEGAAWQVVGYKEGDEDESQGCLSTPQQSRRGFGQYSLECI